MNIWSPGYISRQRTWVAVAIGGGAVIGAGAGIVGDEINKGKPNVSNVYTPGPDASIGESNANTWGTQLQNMASEPDYGAIQPDWNDIWNQTQQQVQNYFSGTATQPGVNDQIDASFAQRGMSGDPAASFLQAQSGANEAQDLGNLSAQQNIAENQFGLQGQQNWMQDEQAFQNSTMPAQGNWGGQVIAPTEGQQVANTVGTAASGAAALGIQSNSANNQNAYLQAILGQGQNPTGFSSSLTDPQPNFGPLKLQ